MRLNVEIKENKFFYSYEVGDSKHSGSSFLSADLLCLFTNLLSLCSAAYRHSDKEWEREAMAKAYYEKLKEKP